MNLGEARKKELFDMLREPELPEAGSVGAIDQLDELLVRNIDLIEPIIMRWLSEQMEAHCKAICPWCRGDYGGRPAYLRTVEVGGTVGTIQLWWHGSEPTGNQCAAASIRKLEMHT
jgi:hypothetical protein